MSVYSPDGITFLPDNGMGEIDWDEETRLAEAEEAAERMAGKQKLSSPDEDEERRVVNYLYMGRGLWDWLKDRANEKGMKLEHYMITSLEEKRRDWQGKEDTSTPEKATLWARERIGVISNAYEDAYICAVGYRNHPTDEGAQLLHEVCEQLGLDPEELMQRISQDRFADFVTKYNGDKDSKMSRCVKWVIEFCRDQDEIPSEIFNKAGRDAGYTRQMLSTARSRVGIDSILRGGRYYLSMPKSARVLNGEIE